VSVFGCIAWLIAAMLSDVLGATGSEPAERLGRSPAGQLPVYSCPVLLIGAAVLPGKLAVKGGAQRRAEHATGGSALEGELSR
jgi:hypothetical protein